MDAKEHAEIWSRAARIVANMDPRRQWQLPPGIDTGAVGRPYTQTEVAMWDAFSAAAAVLSAIAREYATSAPPSEPPPKDQS